METAQEASSLFGAPDPATDPFAAGLDSQADSGSQSFGNDPFANQVPSSASSFFDGITQDSSPFGGTPASQHESNYGLGHDVSWDKSTTSNSSYGTSASSYAAGNYGNYSQQNTGYGTQQGQWSGYEPRQYTPAVNGTHTTQYQNASSQQYDPYAPTYNTGATYAPPAPTTRSSQASSYAPYTPSYQPPAHNPYAPSQERSQTQPVSDPYRPVQSTVSSNADMFSINPAYTLPPASAVGIPVPPATIDSAPPVRSAAAASAFRPKTSNAYDPPIPPPKTTSRRTPAPAWQATSPTVGAPYSRGGTPIGHGLPSSPLPPPPRRDSSRQFATPPPPSTRQLPHSPAVAQYSLPPQPVSQTPPPLPNDRIPSGNHAPTAHNVGSAYDPYAKQATWSQPAPPVVTPYESHSTNQAPAPIVNGHAHYEETSANTKQDDEFWGSEHPAVDVDRQDQDWTQSHTQTQEQSSSKTHDESVDEPAAERDEFDWEQGEPELGISHMAQPSDDSWLVADPEADIGGPAHEEAQVKPHAADSSSVAVPAASALVHDLSNDPYKPIAAELQQPEVTLSPPSASTSLPTTSAYDPYAPTTALPQQQATAPPYTSAEASSLPSTYDPYKPTTSNSSPAFTRVESPDRTKSPGASSVKSWSSSQRQSLDKPRSSVISPPPPRGLPSNRSSIDSLSARAPSSYDPSATGTIPRTASPASYAATRPSQFAPPPPPARDPYAPPPVNVFDSRARAPSSGSLYSVNSPPAPADDPYAPSRHPRQASIEAPAYGGYNAAPVHRESVSSYSAYALPASQVVTLSAPTHAYAPSPSLVGSNDPLGRTSARIPVFSFGFAGKLVTCFHGASSLHTGFDVAMSARTSTDIHIKSLSSMIPEPALDSSSASFPGPLFSDPGISATLVRPGAATQVKNKKTQVIKYLEDRAEEISKGLGYLHNDSVEGHRAEAKRILINLLKVMVENDGRLSGTPQIDVATRSAFISSANSIDTSESLKTPATLGFSLSGNDRSSTNPNDSAIAVHTLKASHLDKIQKLLLRGERRTAYQYAADEKLWAHAMVIASSIDKDAWKEVVSEFVRTELASKGDSLGAGTSGSSGHEPLRVIYSLFAGQGAAAVQELMPPKALTTLASTLSIPPAGPAGLTPISPNFPVQASPMVIPPEVLAKWPETAAMMISSPMTSETSAALTALGDHLAGNNWIEAAHACYLLSPQTSLLAGVGAPAGRVVLYGAPNPLVKPNFWKDSDPFIFSEIAEFALSLAAPVKGQEVFAGIPHLQPYRLLRAMNLAEMGNVQLANRYCDAISNSLSRNSPHINLTFVEQLKIFMDRLTAAPVTDKSGSWISGKMTRPSLDKIGGLLQDRFTRFIAGDSDSPKAEEQNTKETTFSGPFSHYSTISSANSSAMPSPKLSATNLTTEIPPSVPFGLGQRPANAVQAQITRASSAIDYLRRKPSPVPRISSASAIRETYPDASSWSPPTSYNGVMGGLEGTPKPERSTSLDDESNVETPSGPQMGPWWGSSETESGVPTPIASSFGHSEAPSNESEGFVSLMDDPNMSTPLAPSRQSSVPPARLTSHTFDDDDDDDDLGLGNSSRQKKGPEPAANEISEGKPEPAKAESAKESEKPATPTSGGGWLSRLWGKKSETPGPVKANLGDQSSFYYDKELKRWVNKNVAPEAAAPSPPPPPPPRAQTASPAMATGGRKLAPPPSPGMPPPPPRPSTTMPEPPQKPPMRVRSNLVPSDVASAPTTPATAGPPRTPSAMSTMMDGPPGLDGPPPPGSRGPKAKRNARSRYVDVFQQEGAVN